MLRPRPTGHRRTVAGYLTAACGAGVSTAITAGFVHAANQCTVGGFGCLGLIFRGITLGLVVGLAVFIGSAVLAKLGGLYIVAAIGCTVLALTVAVLLGRAGLPPLPIAFVLLAAVPALAAWTTRSLESRMRSGADPGAPATAAARSRSAAPSVPSRALQPIAR